MAELFDNKNSGAEFSDCGNYRYSLWRIWDESKPLVMFIGLNPSTANQTQDDPTIKRVISIAKNNGYGGVYMMNCFAYVSTDPNQLLDVLPVVIDGKVEFEREINFEWLQKIWLKCKDVVFAWGNFDVVAEYCRDIELTEMFPNAKALHINKNGSPKHPLYCRADSKLINFKQ